MSSDEIYRWHETTLRKSDIDLTPDAPIAVADSWLVTDGTVLALALHRERFLNAVRDVADGSAHGGAVSSTAAAFWDAAVAAIPRRGQLFPRVELRRGTDGDEFILRLRPAPEVTRSVVVASIPGGDPRTQPRIKGPDLQRMAIERAHVAKLGAGEAVVLTDEGFVVEGAYSALLWWRGTILCGPPATFDRIDSVTARSVLALAAALGVETFEEAVTPAELDGTELWSVSALHGVRIVTAWVDGPALAELPRRLSTWRARLEALRQAA
ncbi:branched-subunit amino acid aminotransferase/4-amino-4-deoxychorismate lyase [Glaciihabitans tibetensis]|uniref:Branched-subunit amino acid aminotransferase/4-amino-4-deoxychorismate lyase n=1 Tax=Glaciihabitans tibetensis TaxID=1266600 RepID=A0A2T0VIZ2_9MICO|nr:aminotransferase class IV [Glaciihabitans tibetensis]PRY70187.1 branched-subunit amino acid aminotransferase/4-amino-4-deoxychorismate lyase [Glaciihabitans tibetensis]